MPNPRVVPIRPGEGNPRHETKAKRAAKLKVPASLPREPDWTRVLPDDPEAQVSAAAEWAETVPPLHKLGILSGPLDVRVLIEYCTIVARIEACERDISVNGLTVRGQYPGVMVRNPNTLTVAQYRSALRPLMVQLGLAPYARASLKAPDGDTPDDENPWTKHAT